VINYKETHPHNVYEKGDIEELEMIDEAIRINILGWRKPKGKDFYITSGGKYVYSIFQPTRRQSDAMYLFSKFHNIELEKEDERYFACIYTGEDDGERELIYFVEAPSYELAISLAAYESIEYYGK
jgi:hypothetical protein